MIPGKEIHVLDKNAEFRGVPTITLMEKAGKGVADFVIGELKSVKNILFFCGTGNNGGDGFVAARYLSEKYKVEVFLTDKENEIKTDISKKNFEKLKKADVKIYDVNSLKNIDGIISIDSKDDKILITCEPSSRINIISEIKNQGFDVKDIKTIEPSLEEAFMKLISKDEEEN